jgi:hypothetical protein
MFDGDVACGPVPHLFAISPPDAKAAVSADPARTFRDLQRIWSKIFIPENLAASKSWDYLNNTRYPKHSPIDCNLKVYTTKILCFKLFIEASFISYFELCSQSSTI